MGDTTPSVSLETLGVVDVPAVDCLWGGVPGGVVVGSAAKFLVKLED